MLLWTGNKNLGTFQVPLETLTGGECRLLVLLGRRSDGRRSGSVGLVAFFGKDRSKASHDSVENKSVRRRRTTFKQTLEIALCGKWE